MTRPRTGDVILVRPGDYSSFDLEKAVLVKASDSPFSVQGTININLIDAGDLPAGISGLELTDGYISIYHCSSPILIENVRVVNEAGSIALLIQRGFNVHISGFFARVGSVATSTPLGSIQALDSRITLADIDVRGADGLPGAEFGYSGKSAVYLTDTYAVFQKAVLVGGDGGDSLKICHDIFDSSHTGAGGAGLLNNSSEVFLLGNGSILRGGDAGRDRTSGCTVVVEGSGGHGYSDFTLYPDEPIAPTVDPEVRFEAGLGNPDGVPYNGPPSLNGRWIPRLETTPSRIRPGERLTYRFDGARPGLAVFVVSDRGGFEETSNVFGPGGDFAGPRLSAVPGTFFLLIPLGSHDGHGTLSGILPADPALQGLPLFGQVLNFPSGPQAKKKISNSMMRIIGE